MEIYKSFLGNLNKGTGIALDYIFSGLILVVGILVNIFSSIRDLILVGGCLVFFLIFNPIFLYNPAILTIALLLFVFPLIGRIAISWLKYIQYMVTEYFYEKADFYLLGRETSYSNMGDYGQRYKRMQEQKRRAEEEERMRQQQKEWEEFFKTWTGTFTWDFDGEQGQYGNQGQWQQRQGPGSSSYMGQGFVQKYEQSCAVLGVPETADKYEIKLAYRKKAKEYHPDVNKSPGATEMFQKIGEAYEFLSDANIEKYKNLRKSRGA